MTTDEIYARGRRDIERYVLPQERDIAAAIFSQSTRQPSRIDDIQVMHLLQMGFAAGCAQGRRQAADAIRAVRDGTEGRTKPVYWRAGMREAAVVAEGGET